MVGRSAYHSREPPSKPDSHSATLIKRPKTPCCLAAPAPVPPHGAPGEEPAREGKRRASEGDAARRAVMPKRLVAEIVEPRPASYRPGHHLHAIQGKLAGADRDHWALVTVVASLDGTLIVEYDDGHLTRLVRYLPGGLPPLPVTSVVRLNARFRVLAHPTAGWLSVQVTRPRPDPPTLPAREMRARSVVVDLSSGTGMPVTTQ